MAQARLGRQLVLSVRKSRARRQCWACLARLPSPSSPPHPQPHTLQAVLTHEHDPSGFQLRVPDFSVRPGELVAVVGRVGAGKSSLIQALLGNMHLNSGSCHSGGRIAYVPQVWWCVERARGGGEQAWQPAVCPPACLLICRPARRPTTAAANLPTALSPTPPRRCQNLTLQENIVFGQPWDQERYERVLHACALELDLEILAAGDQTKVGGGQRGVVGSRTQ